MGHPFPRRSLPGPFGGRRKKYALLQTPVFVEEFILDRTLDPAIEEFGLAKVGYESRLLPDGRLRPDDRFKMIDPACGSGHFLLGSFSRLVDRWRRKEPATKTTVLVQRRSTECMVWI